MSDDNPRFEWCGDENQYLPVWEEPINPEQARRLLEYAEECKIWVLGSKNTNPNNHSLFDNLDTLF